MLLCSWHEATAVKVAWNTWQTKRIFSIDMDDLHDGPPTTADTRTPTAALLPGCVSGVHHSPITYNVSSLGHCCPMLQFVRSFFTRLPFFPSVACLVAIFCTNHSRVHHRAPPTQLPENLNKPLFRRSTSVVVTVIFPTCLL